VACIREDGVSCDRAAGCMTLPMWQELDALINAYLDGVRLTDLINGARWKIENTTGDRP
jgi:DNA-binding IscR family transcriptional regulator